MLRYPCLVLDHDDTVVMSESTVNYPCFLLVLDRFRPGAYMDPDTFTRLCFDPGFAEMLVEQYAFTEQELHDEFRMWLEYLRSHTPPIFPGIRELVLEQKRRGGRVCVVSHSGHENILRDYREQIGVEPDMIFSWDNPKEQRKPNPYPLFEIMKTYGFQPQELLMVDDLKPGRDMAVAAGVEIAYAGWCRQNVPEIGEIMRSWCDYSFDTVEELHRFLFGDTEISLEPMTNALFHEYYRDYENDPDLYMDMTAFEPYRYTPDWVENYIQRKKDKKQLVFAVMEDGKPVGEVLLKSIDYDKGECTLGICLQNDSVKGRGIGTRAEQLILDYATKELGMNTVYADAIQKNTRSQHVLEKVGFVQMGEDSSFKYYRFDCR